MRCRCCVAQEEEEESVGDGLLGKTLSFATGGMLGKKKKDDALGRTATMTKASRTPTMAKGKQNGGGEKKVVTE